MKKLVFGNIKNIAILSLLIMRTLSLDYLSDGQNSKFPDKELEDALKEADNLLNKYIDISQQLSETRRKIKQQEDNKLKGPLDK